METHALVARLNGIYAIVNEGPDTVGVASKILAGGVRIVQYRAKNGIVPENVRALRALTRASGALLILNDDWRAVAPFDADGAHVGPDDAALGELAPIRRELNGRLLGVSCGTSAEAADAERAGADYIGAGCVFPTQSKADAGDPIGIDGLLRVANATALPVAAIGGITLERIPQLRASGIEMAAVISALLLAGDPQAAAAGLVAAWNA